MYTIIKERTLKQKTLCDRIVIWSQPDGESRKPKPQPLHWNDFTWKPSMPIKIIEQL